MKKFFSIVTRRIFKHWQSSVKGLLYVAVTVMFLKKELTVTDWIAAVGFILSANSIFLQKDPDKVVSKPDKPKDEVL